MAGEPDWHAGTYEFQRLIVVVTDRAPQRAPKQTAELTVTFVTDGMASALNQAKALATDKQVSVVGGPGLAQQLLRNGWVDELQIGIMPVLLGKGQRLSEGLEDLGIRLEKTRAHETGARTDLWLRIVK